MSSKKEGFYVTEGNIFADLELENPEELLMRSQLLSEVSKLIKASKQSQKEIAKLLGITQPKVSMLVSGKLSAFSTDTLLHYLSLLGCQIEIRLKKPKRRTFNIKQRSRTALRRKTAPIRRAKRFVLREDK